MCFAVLHHDPDGDQHNAKDGGTNATDAARLDLALDLAKYRDHQEDDAGQNEHSHHGYIHQLQDDVLHD